MSQTLPSPAVYIEQRCRTLGVDHHAVVTRDQRAPYPRIRARLAWTLREIYPGLSLPSIARLLGCRSHATMIHAMRLIDAEVFGHAIFRDRNHHPMRRAAAEAVAQEARALEHASIERLRRAGVSEAQAVRAARRFPGWRIAAVLSACARAGPANPGGWIRAALWGGWRVSASRRQARSDP